MSSAIRDIGAGDVARIVELNAASMPEVGVADESRILELLAYAAYARCIGEPVAAFLIAMAPGADYASPNYRWFAARYDDFLYIDRIAVDASRRRAGLGAALYTDIEDYARGRHRLLACEVNIRPENARSLAFHAAHGFEAVGTQHTEGGAKTVQLMVKRVG